MWQEQPADDGCEFVNRSTGEMLIVSILRNHEMGGASEMRPTIERLDAIRRTMLATASLTGHPGKGADASKEFKLAVVKD